ncbi:hypothetical protein E2320_001115 [Naja naja]|nr:hypothetical protein E2320_001115 [Naja naja]
MCHWTHRSMPGKVFSPSSGLIRTQENDFLISPLPQHLAQQLHYMPPAGHHPHVLYKRTAEEKVHRHKVDPKLYHFPPDHHSNLTAHKYHIPANDYRHGRFQKQHFCGRRKKYSPKPPTEDTFILSDEYGSQVRLKRSPIKNQKGASLNVETLVVADRKMLEKHSKENITTYILTVMNMVSSLFKDGTIGSDINIIVVSLLLLEQEPALLQSVECAANTGVAPSMKILALVWHLLLPMNLDTSNNGVFSWSVCSRQYLNKFLNTAQAACLIDEPKQAGQYKYPDKLPGQIYDADTQCKWQFGAKAKLCNLSFVKDGSGILLKNAFASRDQNPGSRPFLVDVGDTSDGTEARGPSISVVANPSTVASFAKAQVAFISFATLSSVHRTVQTSEPSSVLSIIANLSVDEEDRCKLYCTAEDFDFFFAMSNRVKDGTPCSLYKEDVCIDGVCEQVGCDHHLGSKAAFDACGVCKGDNSSCTFYSGHYLTQHKTNNYYPIVTIPAGARGIEIQELFISSSYLAVRNLNKKYYLTKDWTVDWPGKFYFAGTMFDYQRPFSHPEKLSASGPTNETLIFELLCCEGLLLEVWIFPGMCLPSEISQITHNSESEKKGLLE